MIMCYQKLKALSHFQAPESEVASENLVELIDQQEAS